jgi:ribosomal protein L29
MKKSTVEQFNSRNTKELQKQLNDNRDKLWSLKTDLVSGKVKNVREIKKLKRDIARILTVMKSKEQATK